MSTFTAQQVQSAIVSVALPANGYHIGYGLIVRFWCNTYVAIPSACIPSGTSELAIYHVGCDHQMVPVQIDNRLLDSLRDEKALIAVALSASVVSQPSALNVDSVEVDASESTDLIVLRFGDDGDDCLDYAWNFQTGHPSSPGLPVLEPVPGKEYVQLVGLVNADGTCTNLADAVVLPRARS